MALGATKEVRQVREVREVWLEGEDSVEMRSRSRFPSNPSEAYKKTRTRRVKMRAGKSLTF